MHAPLVKLRHKNLLRVVGEKHAQYKKDLQLWTMAKIRLMEN